MICTDTPTHGWMCGWFGGSVGQWVGSGLMTNNGINLDLIEIIQFCLKIYDLCYIGINPNTSKPKGIAFKA